MIGIPLYLVAFGGFGGADLSRYMSSDGEEASDDDTDETKTKKKTKRPHDDPGSPLDISDLGGLGGLVGMCALVVIAFTLFPQELNGVMNSVSGGLELSTLTPWGKKDDGRVSGGGVPQGATVPSRAEPPPMTEVPPKMNKVRLSELPVVSLSCHRLTISACVRSFVPCGLTSLTDTPSSTSTLSRL
jgi:hypothetical protein